MEGFYRSAKNYERTLGQLLASRRISPRNKKTLKDFVQRLLAEGISPARIKKYLFYIRNITEVVGKDYRDYCKQDLERLFAAINSRGYSDLTVNDHKTALKRLFRFVEGRRFNPEKYRWIRSKSKPKKKFDISYNDLLTAQEVQLLIKATSSLMYKCLLSLAYETGARPSELLTLTVNSMSFAEGYTRISINESKTFVRTIYAMDSDRYLKAWLNVHPMRDNPAAPLFPSVYKGYMPNAFLQPEAYNVALKRLARHVGLKKRVFAYLFRHSRVTHLLEAGWNEVMIKKLVGQAIDSKAFKFYEHLAEKQVEEYILKQRSKEKTEQKAKGLVEEKVCTFCKTENGLDADFCVQCNRAISMKGLMQSQEKEKELLKMLTPDMIDQLVEKKVEAILKSRVSQAGA